MSQAIILLLTCSLLGGPTSASAQSGPIFRTAETAARAVTTNEALAAQSRSKGTSVVTGAVIGAITAAAITAWAAASYGENEGGKFCANCMLQWSALSVPVGAGLGAGIGFAVASIRSSATAGGRFPQKQAGVAISARF